MTFDEWLATVPLRTTPKGTRLDLRLYVYPDGHGNFCVDDAAGRSFGNAQPVNNAAEAREVLESLWTRAMATRADAAGQKNLEPTLFDQFKDVIGIAPDLPEDMAEHHDHYIHGTQKK